MQEFHLDEDDLPVGRIMTRREVLALLGASAPALFLAAGCSNGIQVIDPDGSTTCTAKPQLTQGPYYIDSNLERSDIRADTGSGILRPGVLLALTFNVTRISGNSCVPLPGAVVDVWHCDALGAYSGVNDPQFGNTLGQNWLRGYQYASSQGVAQFTTIMPGWYQGRATHIHFNIRANEAGTSGYSFTSQLFFVENLLTQIYTTVVPYTQRGDAGRLRNANDGIYNQGGSQLLLNPVPDSAGYAATFNIGLVF